MSKKLEVITAFKKNVLSLEPLFFPAPWSPLKKKVTNVNPKKSNPLFMLFNTFQITVVCRMAWTFEAR